MLQVQVLPPRPNRKRRMDKWFNKKTAKIKLAITDDACPICGNREYTVRNNVYTLTIHCTKCGFGYCIYRDGEIRRLENSSNTVVKVVRL